MARCSGLSSPSCSTSCCASPNANGTACARRDVGRGSGGRHGRGPIRALAPAHGRLHLVADSLLDKDAVAVPAERCARRDDYILHALVQPQEEAAAGRRQQGVADLHHDSQRVKRHLGEECGRPCNRGPGKGSDRPDADLRSGQGAKEPRPKREHGRATRLFWWYATLHKGKKINHTLTHRLPLFSE
eukprot:scaffold18163_cov133-Isochrysis_galbana.AAC.3